ncbi:unnamed protein product [Symbiodinium sp. CCMP2456]|nr:unnamed protein product [Symbiodinium sp. CCMP2456]
MEPADAPPGLRAASCEVEVDINMLRGLLARQTELLQQSGKKAMDDIMTRVQKLWEEGFESVEARLAAQKEAVQQLSDRCSMLEQRLQRLEDCHDAAGSASTMVVAEVSDRCCKLEDRLQWLENGRNGTGNASTMAEGENQKGRKKKGRRRNKVATSSKGVDLPLQCPQTLHTYDMGVEKALVEAEAEGNADDILVTDMDLEPGDWNGEWTQITAKPDGSDDKRTSSADGASLWNEHWYTPSDAKRKWCKHSWRKWPRWGQGCRTGSSWTHRGYRKHWCHPDMMEWDHRRSGAPWSSWKVWVHAECKCSWCNLDEPWVTVVLEGCRC